MITSFQLYEGLRESSTELTIKEAKEIFKNNCKQFSFDDLIIERTVDVSPVPYIILEEPRKMKRKSANTKNYYTLLIDNLPEWKEYPKRSKSLICSLNVSYMGYENDVYRVIPFDGSNWGVCPTWDIWGSFRKISGMREFMSELNFIYKSNFNEDLNEDNFNIFVSQINKLSELTNKDLTDVMNLIKTIIQSKNPFKTFRNIFNPNINDFRCMSYSDLMITFDRNYENEIWTDSDCLLVKQNEIIEL